MQNDLTGKGFDFINSFKVENLFGTGKSGYLFQVEVNKFLMGASSTWVLTGDKAGEYRLLPVRDRWLFLIGGRTMETISYSDFNNNGRAEIASKIGRCGHAGCSLALYLYEWQGSLPDGYFKGIYDASTFGSDPYLASSTDDVTYIWKFDTDEITGKNIIIAELPVHNADYSTNCYQFVNYYKFIWGNDRPLKSITPFDDTKRDYCDAIWADYAAAYGHYQEATQVLASVLKNWDQLVSNDLLATNSYWGNAAQDYLRFKLGIWYIFGGQFEQGRKELIALRDSPTTPDFPIVPKIAGAFLDQYLKGSGINAACQAVIDLEDLELSKMPDYPEVDGRDVKANWGIRDYDWHIVNLDSFISGCSMYDPIRTDYISAIYGGNSGVSYYFGSPNQYFQAQSLILSGNYDEGEQIIDSYSKQLERWGITESVSLNSEFLYVTGLLYESEGNTEKAVQNYWPLWKDYPDSLFANIARRKLLLKE